MIRAVFVFPNGMVAVTDHLGKQMPDLQGPLDAVRISLSRALAQQREAVEFHGCTAKSFPPPC